MESVLQFAANKTNEKKAAARRAVASEPIKSAILKNPVTTDPKLIKVTRAEFAWQNRQPIVGTPSILRLRAELKRAGFDHVLLRLSGDHEDLSFTFQPHFDPKDIKGDALLKKFIIIFRKAGFALGMEELGVDTARKPYRVCTFTGPINQVGECGAPTIQGACIRKS